MTMASVEAPPHSPRVERDYLSYSAINTYRSCPLRYYFRYVEQLPEDTVSSALVFGSAIHSAVEHWFRERLAGNPEPNLDQLLAAYHGEWQTRNLNHVKFGKKDDIASLSQFAERVLTTFTASEAARPEGTILGVGEELRDSVIEGCPEILARLDLILETDDAVVIVDFKTAKSRWSQEQARQSSEQLLLYSELVRDLVSGKPLKLEFIVATKTKQPAIDRFTLPVSQQQVNRTREMVKRVWSGIESGLFYPAPSPMSCSGCPFREPCDYWCG